MIALLQRVSEASVTVENRTIANIGRGLLALVAVQPDDAPADVRRLAERMLGYRVFPDESGRMNLSLKDLQLELLLVPQFTLAADTQKGTRPSFTRAANPEKATEYFDQLLDACRQVLPKTGCGEFGAHMQVHLVNDGPVTFWLETGR